MERNGKQRWVEKTPDHLPYVSRIRRWYPDSPIIRIIRDPRDVAHSLRRVAWGAKSLLSALALWRVYDDRSARFFEVDSGCHTLRFEDLVSEPERTLRALCKAIDEPFDPAMLDTSTSARLVNAADEAWKEKVGAGVDVSRAAAWRKSLSEDEIRMCEACLGDRFITYGYPTMDFEFSQSIEVHRIDLLDQFPEVAAELVAQGARLWTLPGERIEASLFVGDPNQWLGDMRHKRFGNRLQLTWTILRRRLGGVPVTWLKVPVRSDVQGYSARLLARLLPRPVANFSVPETSSPSRVA
jgi:Sulfotransferase family